jgi:hypothetical protein
MAWSWIVTREEVETALLAGKEKEREGGRGGEGGRRETTKRKIRIGYKFYCSSHSNLP